MSDPISKYLVSEQEAEFTRPLEKTALSRGTKALLLGGLIGAGAGGGIAYHSARSGAMHADALLAIKRKRMLGQPITKEDRELLQKAEELKGKPGQAAAVGTVLGAGTGVATGAAVAQAIKRLSDAYPKTASVDPITRDLLEDGARQEATLRRFEKVAVVASRVQDAEGLQKMAADLTQARRERLKAKQFALKKKEVPKAGAEPAPGEAKGKYPIPDLAHAKSALARAKQQLEAGNLTRPAYDRIVAQVYAKYPELRERRKERGKLPLTRHAGTSEKMSNLSVKALFALQLSSKEGRQKIAEAREFGQKLAQRDMRRIRALTDPQGAQTDLWASTPDLQKEAHADALGRESAILEEIGKMGRERGLR